MDMYKNIMIAIDLHTGCDKVVLQHGIDIAKECQAKITLLHVIEHINAYGVAQAYPTLVDIEQQMEEEALEQVKQMKSQYAIEDADIIVEIGSPKVLILEKAKELAADLIILGSHGRHGLQLLLGSTANAVLHHALCDVLTVRIK